MFRSAARVSLCRTLASGSGGSRADLASQNWICLFWPVWALPEGLSQGVCICFPYCEVPQGRKVAVHTSKPVKGQRITCCCLGQRLQLKQTINVLKACEEKLRRENVWRIKGIREYPIYSEPWRPYTAQKRMTVQTIKQNSKQKQQNTENRERRPSLFFLNLIPAERGRFVNTPLKHWKNAQNRAKPQRLRVYIYSIFCCCSR